MHQPVVSLVTPTFNRPQYLRSALESALAQTFPSLEVLVCDDGKDGANRRVVEQLGDPRLRYFRNDGAPGVLPNSQVGFRHMRGRFVATLFDDDVLEPTFLERLVPPLDRSPDCVVAFSDHWLIDGDGVVDRSATDANSREWGRQELTPGRHSSLAELALIRRSIPVAMACLFRRSAVDWLNIPQESGRVFDLWLAYVIAKSGGAAWYCSERLTRYRSHGDSATASGSREVYETYKWCWQTFLEDPALAPHRRYLSRQLAMSRALLSTRLLRDGDVHAGRHEALASVITHPTRRGLLGLGLAALPPRARSRLLT